MRSVALLLLVFGVGIARAGSYQEGPPDLPPPPPAPVTEAPSAPETHEEPAEVNPDGNATGENQEGYQGSDATEAPAEAESEAPAAEETAATVAPAEAGSEAPVAEEPVASEAPVAEEPAATEAPAEAESEAPAGGSYAEGSPAEGGSEAPVAEEPAATEAPAEPGSEAPVAEGEGEQPAASEAPVAEGEGEQPAATGAPVAEGEGEQPAATEAPAEAGSEAPVEPAAGSEAPAESADETVTAAPSSGYAEGPAEEPAAASEAPVAEGEGEQPAASEAPVAEGEGEQPAGSEAPAVGEQQEAEVSGAPYAEGAAPESAQSIDSAPQGIDAKSESAQQEISGFGCYVYYRDTKETSKVSCPEASACISYKVRLASGDNFFYANCTSAACDDFTAVIGQKVYEGKVKSVEYTCNIDAFSNAVPDEKRLDAPPKSEADRARLRKDIANTCSKAVRPRYCNDHLLMLRSLDSLTFGVPLHHRHH